MVERGDPSWTKEMECQSSTPRVHGFQTCRRFVTSALNSPAEPSGVHYSRTIGEVSKLSADTSSIFGNREKKNEEKKIRHSSMGRCVRFELYSVVERLQVGVKANERNVVKPVIVCRSKEEQRGGVNGCAVMYLDETCFGHEKVWR